MWLKNSHGKIGIKITKLLQTQKVKLTKNWDFFAWFVFYSVCGHHHNSFAFAFAYPIYANHFAVKL